MGNININFKASRLPKCPQCGSKLSFVAYRWLTNVLGLTKPHFICDFCGWKKTREQVQKDGGLKTPARKPVQRSTVRKTSSNNNQRTRTHSSTRRRSKGNVSAQRKRAKQRRR